jgi:hypothetical protein
MRYSTRSLAASGGPDRSISSTHREKPVEEGERKNLSYSLLMFSCAWGDFISALVFSYREGGVGA